MGLPNKKPGGRAKSTQKGVSRLLTQRKKKTVHQTAMDRLLYEIAVRTQHKAKSMEFEAKNLSETVDNLRHENRALKRLQRSQNREIHDRHDFVDMANLSLKGFRKDVRFSEEHRVDADASVRKKTKKVVWLENESKRYENLLQLDSKLPSIKELEQKIEKADRELELKDERLKELQTKFELDDQRIVQEQKKEKKRFIKLQREIDETVRECHDLSSRIKTAERKIHKTNIYCRKRGPSTQALPAITWYPPAIEQSPTNKVETWLNKHSDSST
ncbi:peroxisomal and mitochondrial division factor 2-like isoform X2 [Stylophora pistillata]|uniref:peroxisomal and mitochondrial division factor 2-like isoform X2 n=1 Tax=Stylophora pistillata TaxID=50429 RepID=UPI000C0500D4|nr:peroxisomal and mitochondrial division factor 2-like isoform X2 [Stylophora pistillata]